MRRHHFAVNGLRGFGNASGRVTIEQGQSDAIFRVRALHSKDEETMLLSDLAQIVLERGAKARAAQKNRGRR